MQKSLTSNANITGSRVAPVSVGDAAEYIKNRRGPLWENVRGSPEAFDVDVWDSNSGRFAVVWARDDGVPISENKVSPPKIPDDSPLHERPNPEGTIEQQRVSQAHTVVAQAFADARGFIPPFHRVDVDLAVTGPIRALFSSGLEFTNYPADSIVVAESPQVERLINAMSGDRETGIGSMPFEVERMRTLLVHEQGHVIKDQGGLTKPNSELVPVGIQFLATGDVTVFEDYFARKPPESHYRTDGEKASKIFQQLLLADARCHQKPRGAAYGAIFDREVWRQEIPEVYGRLRASGGLPNALDWGDYMWSPRRYELGIESFHEIRRSLDAIPADERSIVVEDLTRALLDVHDNDLYDMAQQSSPVNLPLSVTSQEPYQVVGNCVEVVAHPRRAPGIPQVEEVTSESQAGSTKDRRFRISISDYDAAMAASDQSAASTVNASLVYVRQCIEGSVPVKGVVEPTRPQSTSRRRRREFT